MTTRLLRLAAAFATLLVAGACRNDPAPVLLAENAGTTPYTAEQIRAANPPGTTLVFRIHESGQDPVHQTMRFLTGDADGCDMEMRMQTAGGHSLGTPERSHATWTELRDHAAFPPDRTKRGEASCTVPAGRFRCWLYVVGDETGDVLTATQYYFARARPGPPVLYEVKSGGEVTFRMELIEDSRPERVAS